MAGPNPLKQPGLFDLFWLDGKAPPGITTIKSGGNRSAEWQDMQVPGTQGATSNFRFEKVGSVTYEIKVWTVKQFEELEAWIPIVVAGFEARPPKRFKLTDYRFAHNKVHFVGAMDIGAQILRPESRVWTYDVAFKQLKPRTPIGGAVRPPRNAIEDKIKSVETANSVLQSAVNVHNAYRAATKKKG